MATARRRSTPSATPATPGKPTTEAARGATPRRRARTTTHVLNCLESPRREQNWTLDTAVAAGIVPKAPRRGDAAAVNVDLRAGWWKIGDQGSTGSCVGWAAADAVLRWHFTKAGRLGTKERLSVRFLWMASKETDVYTTRPTSFIESDGTWLTAALDIARKFGVVTETELPFALRGAQQMYGGSANTFYAIAAKRKIASYFNLGRNLNAWRQWLVEHGPILTRLDCDDAWMGCSATQGGRLDSYDPASAQGGHAVAIVGYRNGRFIVRNSWGTGWGDKGFAHASDAYAAAAFTEAYGITL